MYSDIDTKICDYNSIFTPHDWGGSRITHAYVPKIAVFCRMGQKEKRWKSSDFQRFAVEVRTSW